jgi:hypothetical protein
MPEFSFENPDMVKFSEELLMLYNNEEDAPFHMDFRNYREGAFGVSKFNHNVNVITALIHVMDYAERHLDFSISRERKLNNIVAAYFHDLGKTKQKSRHAVIGASMLETADEAAKAAFDKFIPGKNLSEKLPYFAAVVNFHDVFGMVSCGEGSAVSIANAVDRLRDVIGGGELDDAITDIWLLSIADIIVSSAEKFKLQSYAKTNPGRQDFFFEYFFKSFKGEQLLDDLKTAKQIAFEGLDPVKKAEGQAAKRIQCLANEVFTKAARNLGFTTDHTEIIIEYITAPDSLTLIETALKAEFGEDYKHAFGSFLQFDYSLGFFTEISERILITFDSVITADNIENIMQLWYITAAKIFKELYKIKGDISWNIEFEEITNSITASEADILIGKQGEEKADIARKNILKRIFLYRS